MYLFARAPREYKADHYLTFTFINSFGDKIFPAARERESKRMEFKFIVVYRKNIRAGFKLSDLYARAAF